MNTLLGYSYQDGGEVPSSYQRSFGSSGGTSPTLAALLRKREKYRAQEEYEEAMREEAKNREKASLFGGFGSLAGSLLLPALTGATGGLGLALMAGLGGGLGKKMGASSGYQGKLDLNPFNAAESEDYSSVMEDEDLIYGKDAFEDMSKSSRDYTRSGMEQDAIVSGLTHALSAGFGGDDSIYAKAGSTNLLKEGAGQRFKDLFKAQAMPKEISRHTPEVANKYALQDHLTGKVPTSFVSSFGSPEMKNIYSGVGLDAGRPNTFASSLMGYNQDIYNPYKKYLMPNSDSLLGF
jgi:hypothetical protein